MSANALPHSLYAVGKNVLGRWSPPSHQEITCFYICLTNDIVLHIILKRYKSVYKNCMTFMCHKFWQLYRLISFLIKHKTTLFVLFTCLHIFEPHNYVSICQYFILLDRFNNITYRMIITDDDILIVNSSSFRRRSFPTSHLTTWFQIPFLFTSLSHFHVINYSQIVETSLTVCIFSQILSTRLMSWSQVVFVRRVVKDGNIYYTIIFSFVYPATVLGTFWRGCLLKSDMSPGDLASSCRGRLSIYLS